MPNEVRVGFRYSYDTIAQDMETRQRLEFDGKKIKQHSKGTDAYIREFHTSPRLSIWIDRIDWEEYFENPIGTPSLGRSQDILTIEDVSIVEVEKTDKGSIGGSLLPFSAGLRAGGQLVQLAESFLENEEVGAGRKPQVSRVFISIPHDNDAVVELNNIYQTRSDKPISFYLHEFTNE